ncbi:hypothetical protein [Dactylosporangium sp. NPDC048998]|uniref:hypothetical protein n=1 Tax=Dactylosporangium sp. NPDC048998 TaxID=3363976 RepID=UPI00371E90FE
MTGGRRDRLRVQLRSLTLGAKAYQILTLRPSDPVQFSVEASHEFRMVRSDLAGTHRLARLLWALSYQRRPGTLLALDHAHLVANADGSPSPPVVFYVHPQTTLDASGLQALHRWLRRPPASERSVTMQTPGYDLARAEIDAWRSDPHTRSSFPPKWHGRTEPPSRVDTVHGMVVIAGSRTTVRTWSLLIGWLNGSWYAGEDCAEPDHEMRFDVHAVDQFSPR